eukprot:CAMPEP_0119266692 /NCGR_PEP_ID=MMETSP1329-20130426/5090_1 /TAXON_ID=114041 /ORGANISM="Genus nov. species nov., Strain RCC1024" /LENGTH=517 /DNA_ID=CAMNT_0007266581 /DNA_START=76 /DNA_END=1626 /DNA_ORIENTATION=-
MFRWRNVAALSVAVAVCNAFAPVETHRVARLAVQLTLSAEEEFVAKVGLVDALRGVKASGEDVVAAGVVSHVRASTEALEVTLDMPPALGTAARAAVVGACARAAEAYRDALASDGVLPNVCAVTVAETARQATSGCLLIGPEGAQRGGEALRRVRRVIAVSSCKGGVGKSTTAASLALMLRDVGLHVGLCDADIHGPSLPSLLGPPRDPAVRLAPERDTDSGRELLEPFCVRNLVVMSYGYLSAAPAYMRGARVAGVVQQLVASVAWRDLDALVVDCPPGTGDAQLTLSQVLAIDAAVVVTTPSRLAFADVVKGVALFDEVDVPVVAVVENMCEVEAPGARALSATFAESHGLSAAACRDLEALLAGPTPLFGPSSARRLCDMWGLDAVHCVPLLANADPAPVLLRAGGGAPEAVARAALAALAADVLMALAGGCEAPPEVTFNGEAFVAAFHGTTTRIGIRALRRLCRCATCVDEATGDRRSAPLPASWPLSLARSGNYALSVTWSDGHESLIPF